MIMTVLRQQPRAAGLVLGLIAANLLAWCWALQAFGDSGALMAASLLAWGYGLRHAVDADHIAAIDNVTRKMMQQGRRPFAVGAWFSLGHSSIVVLASAAIAATATAFSTQMSWLHDTGSVIGTAVSALFLLAMAFINLVILRSVWRSFQAWKRGEPVSDEIVSGCWPPAASAPPARWRSYRLPLPLYRRGRNPSPVRSQSGRRRRSARASRRAAGSAPRHIRAGY